MGMVTKNQWKGGEKEAGRSNEACFGKGAGSVEHISHSQASLIVPDPVLLLCDHVPPCSLPDVQTLSHSPLPHAVGCTQPTIPSAAGGSQLILQAMPPPAKVFPP